MSKFNARKITIDGIAFDSNREGERYLELKLLESAGMISDLVMQPKFQLLPSFKYCGKTIRGTSYTADFEYHENGKTIIEDVKGHRTRTYINKSKRFMYQIKDKPNMEFREVK